MIFIDEDGKRYEGTLIQEGYGEESYATWELRPLHLTQEQMEASKTPPDLLDLG